MNVFDALLRLYPRRFRERFEPGMRYTFARELAAARDRGRAAAGLFWILSTTELIWMALRVRAPQRRSMRSSLIVDWRDAWRSLRSTPLISIVAVLSLGLGIGANTALFTVMNGLAFKPLPVQDPARLVYVEDGAWTNPIWEEIRDRHQRLYAGAFAWSPSRFDTAPSGESSIVDGLYASGSMFRVLGVPAFIGRTFDERDDRHGGGDEGAVAVISHRYWRERFNGDPAAIGRTIHVERKPFTLIGVAAPGFLGPDVGTGADVMIPLGTEKIIRGADSGLTHRSNWWVELMFRLRPDQTLESLTAELNAARPRIREVTLPGNWPPGELVNYLNEPMTLAPGIAGRSPLRTRFMEPLTIVLAIVGVVLLIACANIASLLLARAVARRHELSVRLALGASRLRVSRQLLAESAMLALAGALAGLLFAQVGARALVSQLSTWRYTAHLDLSLDWRVLGFAAGVALVTALLFGLAPIMSLSGVAPNEALKERGRGNAGERTGRLRGALVVMQVALSLALVVAAGLFVRSYATLTGRDRGFTKGDVLIAQVDLQAAGLEPAQRVAAFERMRDAAAAVSGVSGAAASYTTPISGRGWNDRVITNGSFAGSRGQTTWVNLITPGWLDTFGIRLVEGRDFNATDRAGSQPVAIVDRAFATKYLQTEHPVGRHFSLLGPGNKPVAYEVVGLVENTLYRSLRSEKTPTIFRPLAHWDEAMPNASISVTAAAGSPKALSRAVGEALLREQPQAKIGFNALSDQIAASVTQDRLVATLSSFFGLLALLLAALGIYGVAAYGVSRRRREIGIRMALGADPGAVVRMVLRGLGLLLGTGLVAGAALSWWAAKYVATLLYELQPQDPSTLTGAVAVLAAVGLLAGWLPARRAAGVDPTIVLRD